MYAIAAEKDGRLDYVLAIIYQTLGDARRALVMQSGPKVIVYLEKVQ